DWLKALLRVRYARYAPVLNLSEKELVKMLEDRKPETSIRAIRSLPRTTDKATLEKLLRCLDRPYFELQGFPEQFPVYPVAEEAQEAIVFQGQPVVPLLLELARKARPKKKGWPYSRWPYRLEVA